MKKRSEDVRGKEIQVGQKLRTLTDEIVIVVGIDGKQMTVRYKGKDYDRHINIIGEKLFVI